jgi:hypothetical protein
LRDELQAKRDACEKELDEKREAAVARWREREQELDHREEQLRASERKLATEKRSVEFADEDNQEYRRNLEQRVEHRTTAVREELEHRINSLQAHLELARNDRDAHAEMLREREKADRRFGQKSPSQVMKELESLQKENDRLQSELAERPDLAAAERLKALEVQSEAWEFERLDLQRQNQELNTRMARTNIAATELETLRDQKAALESQRVLLQRVIDDLRAEMEQLTGRAEARLPFPACCEMDANNQLQTRRPVLERLPSLEKFAEDLRDRIASDGQTPLYYSAEDIRSFLGGLAMSPLVLLQGLSGTGKTSLPRAFARAVGTEASIIEVQAGWRDPQDLVGHFNAFEKKFYEKEFLKALYRASLPAWEDTIQIILLDEMNLSHPEQYFSDLLSALALPAEDRRIVVTSHAVEPAPALFEGGNCFKIPRNVWFVGTANHDETTKDFADKTYDRSHVMQFPERPEIFEVQQPQPRHPVSYTALRRRSTTRSSVTKAEAQKSIDFLEASPSFARSLL